MLALRILIRNIVACGVCLVVSSCATHLDPTSLPAEYTPPPSLADHWVDLEAVRNDNWFHLLNSGLEALDWRLRAIDSATQSIQLQSFLWQFDISGSMLMSHIFAAADRGVRIRILIDDSFIVGQDQPVIELDAHPGIEYRIFNPFKRRANHVATREILNLGEFHRLDHRMHNKSMVIDNRVAIIGGRNLADDYFGLGEAGNFRDMEIIAAGPIVQNISSSFDKYWNDQWSFPARQILDDRKSTSSELSMQTPGSAGHEIHVEESESDRAAEWAALAKAAPSGSPELIVDDPPVRTPGSSEEAPVQLAGDIIGLIDSAHKELRIVSAYLIPTAELEAAVERAEDRGVEVHLLTNSIQSNNHITAHSAYRDHIERLIDHGADLHEVRVDAAERGTYMLAPVSDKQLALHAKLMVVDGSRVFIGSANFDARSLRINTEMGLLIESEELGQQVLDAIAVDFLPQNAWHIRRSEAGKLQWVSDDEVLDSQPAASFMQRIEDWFFAHLPLEDEM
jgi:putative cardiolipin synthase